MKIRITTIVALLAAAMSLSAQKGYVSSADYELTVESPDLDKAKEKILAAEKHEKTISYAKTYTVKARVFSKIYAKDNTNTDALFTALESLKKAQDLNANGDAKGKGIGKYTDEIKKDYVMLRIDFQNCGANAYNAKDYAQALKCFDEVLNIDKLTAALEEDAVATIDTAIVFNAAICAYYSENKELTEDYMLKCIEYNYGESTPHTVMYIQYKDAGDTVKMVEILKDGFKQYPDDATFLRELVVYYIGANDLEEGMKYINIALDKDPENSSFWFTKGTFHDQAKESELAMEAYNKAIETASSDEERYNANYNLAVIYYNAAVEAANNANEESDMKKQDEMGKQAKLKFKECIPYFESCLADKPNDLETLKALRPVYYRLSDDAAMMAKYEELQKQIKTLEELQ